MHLTLLRITLPFDRDIIPAPRNSQGFEILNQSSTLVGTQQPANDAFFSFGIVELVAGVTVASFCGIEYESSRKFIDAIAHVHRIILTVTEVEVLRAFSDRRQQRIEIGDRAVVKVGWGCPNAVKWPNFVGERSPHTVRAESVHLLAQFFRDRRFLAVVPVVRRIFDDRSKRRSEFVAGDSETRWSGD